MRFSTLWSIGREMVSCRGSASGCLLSSLKVRRDVPVVERIGSVSRGHSWRDFESSHEHGREVALDAGSSLVDPGGFCSVHLPGRSNPQKEKAMKGGIFRSRPWSRRSSWRVPTLSLPLSVPRQLYVADVYLSILNPSSSLRLNLTSLVLVCPYSLRGYNYLLHLTLYDYA